MHFASARKQLFVFLGIGWAGGFPEHALGDYLHVVVSLHGGKARGICAQFIHGVSASTDVSGGYDISAHVRIKFTTLFFYPHYTCSGSADSPLRYEVSVRALDRFHCFCV